MYLDALSFLEDERDSWRPYEALDQLTDAQLAEPVAAARGWSGRDLMAHIVAWQTVALDIARELAVGETSRTLAASDADWDARGGDVVNAEIQASWEARPMNELRDQFRTVAGELRGHLTVVPEARWVKHPTHMASFIGETIDHYEDHLADLRAILAAGR